MKKSFYAFFAVVALGAGIYFFAQGMGFKAFTAHACEGGSCEGPQQLK
jgi:hypothetical protein